MGFIARLRLLSAIKSGKVDRVITMLEGDGTLVAAGHFPQPGFGRFSRVDGRRVWRPLDA